MRKTPKNPHRWEFNSPNQPKRTLKVPKKNHDVFAWSVADISGIPHKVINHQLDVNPKAKPVKQKKRKFSTDKLIEAREEVDKLFQTCYIRKVKYLEWLFNMVMVKKSMVSGGCTWT